MKQVRLMWAKIWSFRSADITTAGLLLVAALNSGPVFGSVAAPFVQEKDKQVTSGTSNSVALSTPTVGGDGLVVYVIWDNRGSVSVSDTAGNSYISAVGPTLWNNGTYSTQIFYAKDIKGGVDTVTAQFKTRITSFGIVYVHEYSGLDRTNPVDGATAAAGSSGSLNSGSLITTSANDLLFAGGVSSFAVTGAGPGYAIRSTAEGNITEDRAVSTAGTYNASANHNGTFWAMQMVAFRFAGSTTGDVNPPTAPTGLTATPSSTSQINLSWNAASDIEDPPAQLRYQVYRNGVQVGATGAGVTSWQDTGLQPSTGYNYAVAALDMAGNLSPMSVSAQATTLAPLPTIASFRAAPASIISGQTTTLSWTVSNATSLTINNGVGDVTSRSSIPLQPTNSITYILTASNSVGSATAQVAVGVSPDTVPPSVPSLTATAVSATQANLNWTASTDNVGVAGYRLYRNGSQLGQTTATTYSDLTLTAGATYSYTVVAFDAAGNSSAPSAAATVSTSGSDTQAPSVSITGPANNQTLSGSVPVTVTADDNVGVVGVQYMIDGSKLGQEITVAPYSGTWNTTQTPDGVHVFTAVARDAAGNRGTSSGITVTINNSSHKTYTTNFPVTESPISENNNWVSGSAGLDWSDILTTASKAEGVGPSSTAFSDPTAILAGNWGPDQSVSITVYSNGVEDKAATGMDKEVEIRLRTSISPHVITGYEVNCRTPDDSQSYLQIVRWNGALGDFTPLNSVFGTGCNSGDVLMATISGSTINVYRNGKFILTANDNTFRQGSPGIGFNFGCGDKYGDFGIVSFTASDTSSTDTTPPTTPSQLSATPVSPSQINLTWKASTDDVGVVGYQVYRDNVQIATTVTTSFSDTGLSAGIQYSYAVAAYDAAGLFSPQSAPASATTIADDFTPPSVPGDLQASNITPSSLTVSWTASTDNVAVAGYRVFRNGTQVGSTTNTTFSDNGLVPGTTYSYTVEAFDSSNNFSGQSSSYPVTTAVGPANPPSFVQANQNQIARGTSCSVAFSSAPQAKHTLVVYLIWDNTNTASVKDTRGNSFIAVGKPVTWGGKYSAQVFYATNVASGSDTVTATFKTSVNSFGVVYIHEYAGIDAVNPVDVTASASGSSSVLNSGSAVTTSSNDLIFGAGVSDWAVTATGANFAPRDLAFGNVTEDQVAASAGSYSATATHNGKLWGMQLVAFRAAN
jgi:chitodextrinase